MWSFLELRWLALCLTKGLKFLQSCDTQISSSIHIPKGVIQALKTQRVGAGTLPIFNSRTGLPVSSSPVSMACLLQQTGNIILDSCIISVSNYWLKLLDLWLGSIDWECCMWLYSLFFHCSHELFKDMNNINVLTRNCFIVHQIPGTSKKGVGSLITKIFLQIVA